jgi:hypothetical protein
MTCREPTFFRNMLLVIALAMTSNTWRPSSFAVHLTEVSVIVVCVVLREDTGKL